jgi:hypothetical protein
MEADTTDFSISIFQIKIHWKPGAFAKHVPKRILPAEYGGDAGPYQQIIGEPISPSALIDRRQAVSPMFHSSQRSH